MPQEGGDWPIRTEIAGKGCRGIGLQRIDEVRICWEENWPQKHLASLKTAYANAPYLKAQMDFKEAIFDGRHERRPGLNPAVIEHNKDCFGISTRLVNCRNWASAATGTGF